MQLRQLSCARLDGLQCYAAMRGACGRCALLYRAGDSLLMIIIAFPRFLRYLVLMVWSLSRGSEAGRKIGRGQVLADRSRW
jgi:hypothetical protein